MGVEHHAGPFGMARQLSKGRRVPNPDITVCHIVALLKEFQRGRGPHDFVAMLRDTKHAAPGLDLKNEFPSKLFSMFFF